MHRIGPQLMVVALQVLCLVGVLAGTIGLGAYRLNEKTAIALAYQQQAMRLQRPIADIGAAVSNGDPEAMQVAERAVHELDRQRRIFAERYASTPAYELRQGRVDAAWRSLKGSLVALRRPPGSTGDAIRVADDDEIRTHANALLLAAEALGVQARDDAAKAARLVSWSLPIALALTPILLAILFRRLYRALTRPVDGLRALMEPIASDRGDLKDRLRVTEELLAAGCDRRAAGASAVLLYATFKRLIAAVATHLAECDRTERQLRESRHELQRQNRLLQGTAKQSSRIRQMWTKALKDLTGAKRELEISRDFQDLLLATAPLPVIVLSRYGHIRLANLAATELLELGDQPSPTHNLFRYVLPEERKRLLRRLREGLGDIVLKRTTVTRMRSQGGTVFQVEIHWAPIPGAAGSADGLMVLLQDITERARNEIERDHLHKRLSYEATHDALTDLWNRRAFEERLRRALHRVQAEGEEHVLCYLDLDQFKVVNDTCGHLAGDELLRRVASILRSHVRRADVLARLGGDEFGLIMENCSLEQASRQIQTLHDAIGQSRFQWTDKHFRISASIGVVAIRDVDTDSHAVLSKADAACYIAKDAGRNHIHFDADGDQAILQRRGEMDLVVEINQALERGRFELFYQPIIACNQDQRGSLHYEILVRMLDADDRTLAPGAFLPTAERFGLAARIDHWVIEHTLSWLYSHPRHVERLGLCSINLSGQSLGDNELLSFVVSQFDTHPQLAAKVCFEITETAAITNLNDAIGFIDTLKSRGCRFALDDFGSGFSSFTYLKTFPADYLKIDGTFVRNIGDDPTDLAMVESIIHIGKVMGKQTIAEFVENGQILAKLKTIGVDFVQGYHFGRPEPITQLQRQLPDNEQEFEIRLIARDGATERAAKWL